MSGFWTRLRGVKEPKNDLHRKSASQSAGSDPKENLDDKSARRLKNLGLTLTADGWNFRGRVESSFEQPDVLQYPADKYIRYCAFFVKNSIKVGADDFCMLATDDGDVSLIMMKDGLPFHAMTRLDDAGAVLLLLELSKIEKYSMTENSGAFLFTPKV
jgi:hypothetical protein